MDLLPLFRPPQKMFQTIPPTVLFNPRLSRRLIFSQIRPVP